MTETFYITKLTKINYMSNQSKNPVFWCLVAVVLGAGLLIWGAIKGDCIGGPGCWAGSGFLKWTGGIIGAAGLGGFFLFGSGRKRG